MYYIWISPAATTAAYEANFKPQNVFLYWKFTKLSSIYMNEVKKKLFRFENKTKITPGVSELGGC